MQARAARTSREMTLSKKERLPPPHRDFEGQGLRGSVLTISSKEESRSHLDLGIRDFRGYLGGFDRAGQGRGAEPALSLPPTSVGLPCLRSPLCLCGEKNLDSRLPPRSGRGQVWLE